jgi:hypothetical protein
LFDRTSSKTPITAFTFPPHRPPAAAKEIEAFDNLGDEWGAVRGERADVEESRELAIREAKAEAVEAAKTGKAPTVSVVAIEQEYDAQIAELKAREDALAVAIDEVGNTAAVAVAENRAAWLATLGEVAAEAEARYAKALADAEAALADLVPARGAIEWLTDFNHVHARIGTQTQFAGGKLWIEHRFPGTLQSEWDPKELLATAGKLLDPPIVRTLGGQKRAPAKAVA